jgi:hypothetical protein
MGKICKGHPKNLIKKRRGLTQAHFDDISCLLETTLFHASYQQLQHEALLEGELARLKKEHSHFQ